MKDIETNEGLPANYDQLKISLNRASNWRVRLEAVEQLGQWDHQKVIDALTHRMNNDTVYTVQEAAYHKLRSLGQSVQLPPRKKGDIDKGLTKVLVRIKKSLPAGHSYEEFKAKLQKMRLDLYDTFEGDKGADFDRWLESTWVSLSTR